MADRLCGVAIKSAGSDSPVSGLSSEAADSVAGRTCGVAIRCPGTDNPFGNLSSEAPDPVWYRRRRSSTGGPRLGQLWVADGCQGYCYSEVSQEEADLCAAAQAYLCEHTPPEDPANPLPPPVFYWNAPQGCVAKCPDGLPFSYSVAGGKFVDLNPDAANSKAYSYACKLAKAHKVCLGELPGRVCLGQAVEATLGASGRFLSDDFWKLNYWEIVSGDLPPGMALSTGFGGTSVQLTGTPTTAGGYTFTVKVTGPSAAGVAMEGDWMQKEFTICVVEITANPAGSDGTHLPDAEVDKEYHDVLQVPACVESGAVWEVTDGELPDGLELDPQTGEIRGTPTEAGDYTFTASVTL